MKVIDLLNKIANGEELHFYVINNDFKKVAEYFYEKGKPLRYDDGEVVEWRISEDWLNCEVKIIEDKINKDIKWYFIEEQEKEKTKIAQINMNFKILREKLTEIIDKLNEGE